MTDEQLDAKVDSDYPSDSDSDRTLDALKSIMIEYDIDITDNLSLVELKNIYKEWLKTSGRWKYHIHGCLDDDNLYCRIPDTHKASINTRYDINITTAGLYDYTGLYPLGLLKHMIDIGEGGISCENRVIDELLIENYNTLSEFYVEKDGEHILHKERDKNNKHVYPYCPKHRGDYMFAGCNSSTESPEGSDIFNTKYREDDNSFFSYLQGSIIPRIPLLSKSNPIATVNDPNDVTSECNDLIANRNNDNEYSQVRCHGPDDAIFIQPKKYCLTHPSSPGCQTPSSGGSQEDKLFLDYTQSYSGITTGGTTDELTTIIDNLCEDDYYPVGLSVQDLKRNGNPPTIVQRDICVPKNDEHGYTYHMEDLGIALDNDFFKTGGNIKNFSEIIKEKAELVYAECAPSGSFTSSADYNGGTCEPVNPSPDGDGCRDEIDKESCGDSCEWWPEHSCKKVGGYHNPRDFYDLEETIKNNLIQNNPQTMGWPQRGSVGVTCPNEGSNEECYISIPLAPTKGISHISHRRCINDPPSGDTTSCEADNNPLACSPGCILQGSFTGEDGPYYNLIKRGDDNGKLLDGIQIPITELTRNNAQTKTLISAAIIPGADRDLISFPQGEGGSIDNISNIVDIHGASSVITPDDQELNPTIVSCDHYFENNHGSGFRPPSGTLDIRSNQAKLYCKKDGGSIKSSFYYGKITSPGSQMIDITQSNAQPPVSPNETWCDGDKPLLMKVADDNKSSSSDNSFYVCTDCSSLSNYGWQQAANPTQCEKPHNVCTCTDEKGAKVMNAEAADLKDCKWVFRDNSQVGAGGGGLCDPSDRRDVGQCTPRLEGCKSCADDQTYLTYANGAQIGLGKLTNLTFPSRNKGDYPDGGGEGIYLNPREAEYEYAGTDVGGGGGIFQPGHGGWATKPIVETITPGWQVWDGVGGGDEDDLSWEFRWRFREEPVCGSTGAPPCTDEFGKTSRDSHIISKATEFTTETSDGETKAIPIPRPPPPDTFTKANELLGLIYSNNNRDTDYSDPNDWYHNTICRNKHKGNILWTKRWKSDTTQAWYPIQEHWQDPRFYETEDLPSRCSAHTVLKDYSDGELPNSYMDPYNGCKNIAGGQDPRLKCCDDNDCSQWTTEVETTSNVSSIIAGNKVEKNPHDQMATTWLAASCKVDSSSSGTHICDQDKIKEIGPDQVDMDVANGSVYAYRGRCLLDDGEPCADHPLENGEEAQYSNLCHGGYCCNGICSSMDCDEAEDDYEDAEFAAYVERGDIGGAIWCLMPSALGGCP